MQLAVNSLSKEIQEVGLQIAPTKTEAINFGHPETSIKVEGSLVPWSQSVKYLGVTINKTMTFANHTTNTINTVVKRTNTLKVLSSRTEGANWDNMMVMMVAKACLIPIMD